jgi:hypothetical protein
VDATGDVWADAGDTCCGAKSSPASSSSEYAAVDDENDAGGEDTDALAVCVYSSLPSQSELDPDPASYSYS